MTEEKEPVPAGIPDWVREAEEVMVRGKTLDIPEARGISIKSGKDLVGEPFTSKSGKELVEMKASNTDPTGKISWIFFVILSKMVYDNKFGKSIRMRLPEDGTTRVSRPSTVATDPNGQRKWDRNVRDISNTGPKSMMEAYKTKNRARDGESVLGSLKERKEEAAL